MLYNAPLRCIVLRLIHISRLVNMATANEERPVATRYPEPGGYDRLAQFMGRHPQLGIFRRFGALAYETLLYYQAEISDIEQRLRGLRAANKSPGDGPGGDNRKEYMMSWVELLESTESDDPDDTGREQLKLIMRLRDLMVKYEKALYYHNHALTLRRPHGKLLKDLREWMDRPLLGRIMIFSCDYKAWTKDKDIEEDLLTFENSMMDHFTALVTYRLTDIYHKFVGRYIHKKTGKNDNPVLPVTNEDDPHMIIYPHRVVARLTRTITVFLACMLPVISIAILYTVSDTKTRLGIIAGLTGFFSISMDIFTMATLPEIFAATAAFAAVLVVFIGSNGNN
ncbi:hypothetical protein F4810DRAFT_666068 [Camillea tinctor]|nr:hypothetical protein F4810DRAFT_666068 [Camillea tinctor]